MRWLVIVVVLLSTIAFAQTQQARNEAPIPEKTRATRLPVLCGKADDGAIHIPRDYNSFMPPDRTQSYVDPEFGCRIRRLTNGPSDFGVAIHHEYSVPFPFNADDTKVLLLRNDGFWMVVDLQGTVLIPPAPPRDGFEFTSSGAEPRWDKKNPNLIYYHLAEGNQLKAADISSGKPLARVLHTFKSCQKITFGNNEVNLSEDGDHIPIICKNGKQGTVGIYSFSRDHLSSTLELTGHNYDWIDVTPDNNLLIRWLEKGPMRYQGIELFDHDLKFVKQVLPYGAHSGRGRDLDGSEVLVVSSAPDHHSSCGQDGAGVQTVRLSDLKKTCLLRQGWWGEVGHLSVSENGWVLITITDDNTPSTAAYQLPPDWKQRWKLYMNEIILARIDGSQVIRLAHTRTRDHLPDDDYVYWAVPRAALSRDGHFALFDSNFGIRSNTADYADVYLIQLQ